MDFGTMKEFRLDGTLFNQRRRTRFSITSPLGYRSGINALLTQMFLKQWQDQVFTSQTNFCLRKTTIK
ncbi:hypothetical protein L596_023394 [Steinernema carpocapsae]|uniref:Uncharacterized protein n=1 Tax=Steinernema carpocapsae TaxID=34508 RepID=A0A4U5MDJ6_STECR|nr:hypothetical protein L596_023394 [Steinernema carpocapsae]